MFEEAADACVTLTRLTPPRSLRGPLTDCAPSSVRCVIAPTLRRRCLLSSFSRSSSAALTCSRRPSSWARGSACRPSASGSSSWSRCLQPSETSNCPDGGGAAGANKAARGGLLGSATHFRSIAARPPDATLPSRKWSRQAEEPRRRGAGRGRWLVVISSRQCGGMNWFFDAAAARGRLWWPACTVLCRRDSYQVGFLLWGHFLVVVVVPAATARKQHRSRQKERGDADAPTPSYYYH